MAKELLNDLIYGEQIVTDGCKVEFAVGLTYSLDLEAMLTVPLAFGELGELDDNVRHSPAFLLEGIRRSSDKIVLFCNKGGIHVPQEAKTIFSLLEGSIFEIKNGNSLFSNFHPKLWLVQEVDKEGQPWLKLAVMSRNLTFSSCLDICCTLRGKIQGRVSGKGREKHKPLKDMLLYLSEYADKQKARQIIELAETLDYVAKFELDTPFQTEDASRDEEEGYAFYPFVFNKPEFAAYTYPLRNLIPGDRILVISPFIDIQTLEWLTSRRKEYNYESSNAILITRKEYVTEGVFKLFDEVWVPNDTMVDNTTAKVDLHAKMYLTHRVTGDDLGYTLYLGSANATAKAFPFFSKRENNPFNCEFLLRLHYKRTTTDRIKELLDEMTSDNQFVKLDGSNPSASDERPSNCEELELKRTADYLRKANITPSNEDGLYDVALTVRGKINAQIRVRPLQCKDYWQSLNERVTFTGLKPYLISEFYVLSLVKDDSSVETVVKVNTIGMPLNRDESIYQSIVTKKEELIDYVAFMLSDRPTDFLFEQQLLKERNKAQKHSKGFVANMPLYEQLLKAASNNPEQIVEVQKFVKKMNPDIVPPELTQILKMFQNVAKQIDSL